MTKKKKDAGAEAFTTSPCRTGRTVEMLAQSFYDSLHCGLGRHAINYTINDVYTAVALSIRDRVFNRGVKSVESLQREDRRIVAYLSAEYLPGPHLQNNLLNLGIVDEATEALAQMDIDIKDLFEQEEEPGLGNGGLGRLASCFMESLASLEVPAVGYGIRYEFGIFDQEIDKGWQKEITDKWLRWGNPWEIVRPDIAYEVKFGGYTKTYYDSKGRYRAQWIPETEVKGVAYDTPILGYRVDTCNILRLWKAEAIESFDFRSFNHGDYYRAVEDKMYSENITKVLYPNDQLMQGKTLRLQQQYFFVACSLKDMIRKHTMLGGEIHDFHKKWAVQLNDTHPAVAVAELMRLLVDIHELDWDEAWFITSNTCSYTNHTLLPEALETWPLSLFRHVLPRHVEIIFEINHHFIEELKKKYPDDEDKIRRMSIIDENDEKYIRMANLATVGSHKVNGVAAMHSELVKNSLLYDFYELWPGKFCNVTNGVTPRRFVAAANPGLTELISGKIGDGWIKHLDELKNLEAFADDLDFQQKWRAVKLNNKQKLANLIEERTGIIVDPTSMFDIQVKRIHEYKRQHLNVLHILHMYQEIKRNPNVDLPARTFIFGGKAAPGYYMAKLIIKLINSVADVINNDHEIGGKIKVVFFPDFNVKNAEPIYPAADLSEQISTAGKEASGTGNMKFSLNGALTIGTLDGANVEIREEVGEDNFFLFGLTAPEVKELKSKGYVPRKYYEEDEDIRRVLEFLRTGALSAGDPDLFRSIIDNLIYDDPFLVLADFKAYLECQREVNNLWKNEREWNRKSILNVARMGKFSSDRSIQDYCDLIWKITPGD